MVNGSSAAEVAAGDPYGRLECAVAVKPWPTPAARDWKDNGDFTIKTPSGMNGKGVSLPHAARGVLNPDWVESLMGFPAGWTRTDGPQAAAKSNTSGKRRASRKPRPNGGTG